MLVLSVRSRQHGCLGAASQQLFIFYFLRQSHCTATAGLELTMQNKLPSNSEIYLPLPPGCCNERHAPPQPVFILMYVVVCEELHTHVYRDQRLLHFTFMKMLGIKIQIHMLVQQVLYRLTIPLVTNTPNQEHVCIHNARNRQRGHPNHLGLPPLYTSRLGLPPCLLLFPIHVQTLGNFIR